MKYALILCALLAGCDVQARVESGPTEPSHLAKNPRSWGVDRALVDSVYGVVCYHADRADGGISCVKAFDGAQR